MARRLLATLLVAGVLLAAGLAWVVQPGVVPRRGAPIPAVDPQRLAAHVRHFSVDLYPRSADQPDRLQRAADDIAAAFRSAGARVEIQAVPVDEAVYQNVIARFGPAEGPVRVIGAHYDSHGHVGAGARDERGYTAESHTPGADDNASGIAALIELAGLLQRHPPAHPVELVAYTLEEPPYFRTPQMGSVRHARSLVEAGRPVAWMLALEMIGYFDTRPGSQAYPLPGLAWLYPDRGDFIGLVGPLGDGLATRRIKAVLAGASDLPVVSINASSLLPGVDFSDHRSYWAEGLPAWMLTDTAFYRNPHYHQAGDTPDTLDYPRMAQVVQMVFALAQSE